MFSLLLKSWSFWKLLEMQEVRCFSWFLFLEPSVTMCNIKRLKKSTNEPIKYLYGEIIIFYYSTLKSKKKLLIKFYYSNS